MPFDLSAKQLIPSDRERDAGFLIRSYADVADGEWLVIRTRDRAIVEHFAWPHAALRWVDVWGPLHR